MTVQKEKMPVASGNEKARKQTPDTGATVTPSGEEKEKTKQQAGQRRKQDLPAGAPAEAPEWEEEETDATDAMQDDNQHPDGEDPNDPTRVDRTNVPDRRNDPTRIRPHVNDPNKTDPTKSAKNPDEIF